MIPRNDRNGFFRAHYDWLVLLAGVIVLIACGVVFFGQLGIDPEADALAAAKRIDARQPRADETGVKPTELVDFVAAARAAKSPATVAEISDDSASFLASESRVKCKCGKAIPSDSKAVPKCPFCGVEREQEVIVLDADGDGLPNDWEKRYGLNAGDPSDAEKDLDGDDFTNIEEFTAKTDPTDKKDHPDYCDSLKVQLPLNETHLTFVFRQATKIPSGWRLVFFDTNAESAADKRKKGANVSAVIGEEIGHTGFVVKGYTHKTEKRERKGMAGMFVEVDVSEVVVERKRDKKCVTLVVQSKGMKFAAVDVQATLVYERGKASAQMAVVAGQEIALSGFKYRVVEVKPEGKGAVVVLEEMTPLAKKHIIKTLE